MKKSRGLTLMELTIALAIIAIVAAITVPMFLLTTDRSRLRADIQSARVLQNAKDLYRAERNENVTGTVEQIITQLVDAGYINPRNLELQTPYASWYIDTSFGVMVDISDVQVGEEVHRAYHSLSDSERSYVRGGR
ncbi:MAG: prepilin-type N-terminal cleavage/methylation domain-containing protein [Defluviitaleaceae bacterium]|nr:prepilin-type N-terminal cleavage/methylation domain-containing protein [Defluviitaleaceae bacterium]